MTSRFRLRVLALASAALLVGATLLASGPAVAVPATASVTKGPAFKRACSAPTRPGFMQCEALVRTDITPMLSTAMAKARLVHPDITPAGYSPANLQSAYNVISAAATAGAGETVAVVAVFNDPNANADLQAYRAQYGLPVCSVSNSCFHIYSQTGSTTTLPANATVASGWDEEESLDIDMVSAICPKCSIDLIEADSQAAADEGTAVNEAVALGARFVSNSYGGPETPAEIASDSSYYNHPGVAITAATGDSGFQQNYPAASPYVTAVGGTTLTKTSTGRGWTETAWSGAGSGCSIYETAKPTWQLDTGCTHRTIADVSAVADINPGVAFYDSYNGHGGWNIAGGTSVAAPIVAGVYALGGYPAQGTYPAQYPYLHTANLYDVTSGTNGSCTPSYLCTAGGGYDGPTGLGTPNGTTAFTCQYTIGYTEVDSTRITVTATPQCPGEQPAYMTMWIYIPIAQGNSYVASGNGGNPDTLTYSCNGQTSANTFHITMINSTQFITVTDNCGPHEPS